MTTIENHLYISQKRGLQKESFPFCGVTGILLLDFWWRLFWVSQPGWIRSPAGFVSCMLWQTDDKMKMKKKTNKKDVQNKLSTVTDDSSSIGVFKTGRNWQKCLYWHQRLYYMKTKCYPQWVLNPWTTDCKSNTLFSRLIWYVLFRRSLNFCSCTTLLRINKAWLHKEPKISVLQANAKLVQKGECWTWNQRLIRGPGSIPTGCNIWLL